MYTHMNYYVLCLSWKKNHAFIRHAVLKTLLVNANGSHITYHEKRELFIDLRAFIRGTLEFFRENKIVCEGDF